MIIIFTIILTYLISAVIVSFIFAINEIVVNDVTIIIVMTPVLNTLCAIKLIINGVRKLFSKQLWNEIGKYI